MQQDCTACIVDIQKALQIGEVVCLFCSLDILERQQVQLAIPLGYLEHQLRLKSAFYVKVKFGLQRFPECEITSVRPVPSLRLSRGSAAERFANLLFGSYIAQRDYRDLSC